MPDAEVILEDRAPTRYDELADFLRHVGKDPSALIFEDELTGIHNRRFLLSHLEHKVRWASGEDFPLALLFMDVDGFKDINDTHGHDTGDQALIWVADLLRTVAGSNGLPVRYGGDEFMLVLPGMDRTAARTVTDRILQHVRDRPFQQRGTGKVIPITLSVGIAAAPDDARDRSELINAADAALYFAKQSGRNQAAAASEIDPEKVFSHTALLRLKSSGISGRTRELNLVDQALRSMTQGRSQAVVFEGAPGVGKTTLLDTIRKNVQSERSFWVTKVAGDAREAGRPYYMVTKILVSLLNEREDGGASLLANLTTEQRSHLAHILPGLVEEDLPTEIDRDTRQSIFKCITNFLGAAVDPGPLVLLIDDFQFVDEATLALLTVAVKRGELTFTLCATVGESLAGRGGVGTDSSPAERFLSDPPEEIQVRTSKLNPLQPEDIAEYLRGIFPNLEMPEGFESDLAQVTSGNPFFLAEIVRVLLDAGKVRLVGQAWVVEPVDVAYLASSLEEIVTQKIAALDQNDREILARASALGEDIPLSVLTGSSDLDESSVQAFLDRAENMGLISLDFQVNDEVMHFLGKRILDISYAAIDEDRRAELHEELGQYQERLYEQRLLPSASMLAYHFRRSANAAKATQYDQVTQAYAESVFESSEVEGYGADQEIEFGTPLQAEAVALIPGVLRSMLLAIRNIQLYPAESAAIAKALESAADTLDQILVRSDRLTFTHGDGVLSANGDELDLGDIKVMVGSVIELFIGAEVKALSFTQGVEPEELRVLFQTLGEAGSGTLEKNFWTRTSAQHGFKHVDLRQMRYSRLAPATDSATGAPVSTEDELTPEELARMPNLLRDLLKAAADIRLYSLANERVGASIRGLVATIREVVGARPAVTVSRIDALLLVNGARVDATAWQAIGSAFVEFMDELDLNSITFMEGISPTDLETFLGALGEASVGEREKGFWEVFAADRELSGIAFNQEDYSLGLIQAAVLGRAARQEDETPGRTGAEEPATSEAEKSEESPAVDLPEGQQKTVALAKEFLLEGKHEEVLQLLRSLCADFPQKKGAERLEAVETCEEIFHEVVLGLQHDFAKLMLTALPDVFEQESDSAVLEKLTGLFYEMAASSIQFSDYRLAARIYNVVDLRRQALREDGKDSSRAYGALTSIVLDDRTRQLLTDDLRSGQTERQSRASLAVGHVGVPAVPMLIAVVKQERDLRMRQIGAGLLAGLGGEAGEELKETLLTEVLLEHRYRVLEVIDMVTTDLRTELVFSLADENPKIRRAAFQLFERLRQDSLIDVVLPLAKGTDEGLAKGAVRSLAYLDTPRAAEALTDILRGTSEPGLAVACCKALGRLKADGAIEALDGLLSQKRWGFLGQRWDEEVRASAAVALRQIGGPRASTALAKHKDDKSARIRAVTNATVGELPAADEDE